jgi:hypothetical protein
MFDLEFISLKSRQKPASKFKHMMLGNIISESLAEILNQKQRQNMSGITLRLFALVALMVTANSIKLTIQLKAI